MRITFGRRLPAPVEGIRIEEELKESNHSWWPISALESDAAKPAEAHDAPEAASPAHWPKESLVLYHWTQSFSSQKVRLVIAEKGLACEERDVSLPQSEHKEPWFMRLNLGEEVPVIIHRDNIISDYDQIIDYVERTFTGENVVALMPEAGSPQHARVLQYRELLDALPMDAYTHGCILHPELTTDSMIPKYATAEIRRHLASATTDLMKLDHEEEPQLSEPYLSKQKKLMAKILEHDDVNYLKKILGELAMVLDQIEAELEKRKLENEGQKCELWLCGCAFTLADVLLGATLHRLKFLGLSKKYWEDGSRPNLQSFFERVQKRFAFRKVLGDIHTTLLSAVIPNAFRLVKRKPPSFFGASFLMGSLGGMGYFAYWYLKKKYI
ncbi:ganglioside-induced differentiation-associated protein 1-like 1 isoform X1 [Artibeus jamaicensis]|uniref:ganglioside-induced differentiation-associated protein 1-like 1 isoform X1 n=2 Tax=Artibeus jamaicensis TaxID=9417 RepID=UPI00235A87C7|nr:ganglioside-induced differentiation-associated protein 1-like 1 isoform X1 [Artibeus jamaicensis]XP_053527085.1 ganglioside-induced differentiation-associated protein 1-like 1 isoform X1 [Artibeus jamaicensis]XP_053527086.1 ganglioside-induced differentiation-associated protein 1-like 1 isoform X1 [Artibeus jamaicensis]